MEKIRFYRVNEPYGEFSNFSPHPVQLKGRTWPTSEHYFQAQKFAGTEHDGWYESSPEIITEVTRKALEMAASHGARKAALTALATGFGHLTFAEFAQGVRPLLQIAVPPIEEIVICLLLEFEVAELACHLPEIECIPP